MLFILTCLVLKTLFKMNNFWQLGYNLPLKQQAASLVVQDWQVYVFHRLGCKRDRAEKQQLVCQLVSKVRTGLTFCCEV